MNIVDEEWPTNSVPKRVMRFVYLVTYSQCDLQKFPTREKFAQAVVDAFNSTKSNSKPNVERWVCSREDHKTEGQHYHLALRLKFSQRWQQIKKYIRNQHGIILNFQDGHPNYYSAWSYVTKEDKEFIESTGHPDLSSSGPPRTTAASKAKSAKRKNSDDTSDRKSSKEPRLTNAQVAKFIIKHKLKTRTELLAFAKAQEAEGKHNLTEFLFNNRKQIDSLISMAWEFDECDKVIERRQKSRLDILREMKDENCITGCDGRWRECAIQTLQRNGLDRNEFIDSVCLLLEKGRGKYRNIMIIGPANCGKTFILYPLTQIYNCFQNPAVSTFNWLGAEKAELIFLNDFRWSPQVIQWNDLLLMLEGGTVHLPAPKNSNDANKILDQDTPIFCTSSKAISYVKHGELDERETEMMRV